MTYVTPVAVLKLTEGLFPGIETSPWRGGPTYRHGLERTYTGLEDWSINMETILTRRGVDGAGDKDAMQRTGSPPQPTQALLKHWSSNFYRAFPSTHHT